VPLHRNRSRTLLYMTWAKNADGRLEATWHLDEDPHPVASEGEKPTVGVDPHAAVADGELVD
jgi:hypothetical protein